MTSTVLVKRWRELCGPVAGAVELRFMSNVMNSGDPIDVQLAGPDLVELGAAAESLKRRIALYDGAFNISDSFRSGKPEVQLDLMPEAERLGLARVDLARQVRQGFYGEEVQRIQRGRDELKVMVRYPADDRRSLHQLESMRVRTPRGAEVPFGTVARARLTSSASTISRTDRMRTVNVTADVDLSVAAPGDILRKLESDVLPALLLEHPGVSYSLEGQNREQGETVAAMRKYFLMAMIAVFALMAIPFRSYVQPLIVMAVIPFGLVGAVAGHWFMEHDMSVLSMCGLVALAGVVVNDSLVLVDRVNQRRNEGASVLEAVRNAGLSRFRPILLTSLTTFMGLLPLMLEKSVQAQFLVPMAISLAFGVVFATLLTLVLVPSLYLVLQDLERFARWLVGARAAAQESEPTGAKLPAS